MVSGAVAVVALCSTWAQQGQISRRRARRLLRLLHSPHKHLCGTGRHCWSTKQECDGSPLAVSAVCGRLCNNRKYCLSASPITSSFARYGRHKGHSCWLTSCCTMSCQLARCCIGWCIVTPGASRDGHLSSGAFTQRRTWSTHWHAERSWAPIRIRSSTSPRLGTNKYWLTRLVSWPRSSDWASPYWVFPVL
jgi:hypothetical protein